MNKKYHFLSLIGVAGLLLSCITATGQELIRSRQTSYLTYIYQITDSEAKELYKNGIWKVEPSFFHTLIDSFPTDAQYSKRLKAGHYIKTFSDKNRQRLFITSVPDFDVKILNNNTDLCIEVLDLNGNIIKDAEVKVRMKHLRFDKITKTYSDRKSNQKGLLSVRYAGYTGYYQLSRKYNNSLVRRGTRTVVYGTPLKYIWMPVNYIVSLPIDGAKSIVKGWPQGSISRTKNFFIKTRNRIIALIDGDDYDSYSYSKFQRKHTGYMVFNKPKYHQGDTVKFKAFLVSVKGVPVTKKVNVVLSTGEKPVELTKLNPYTKGGYEYSFLLHDSLKLQLDRSYDVSLQINERKQFISNSFEYEDYELSKNKLVIRIDTARQYRGKSFKVFVKGTDENNLNLLDARLEVQVKPKEIIEFFDKHVFVPDTLLFFKKDLLATDETPVSLPDSTFPRANFIYTLQMRLITSDNETVSETKDIEYFNLKKEFELNLIADSASFLFRENGKKKEKNVKISATDNFGNITQLLSTVTPCKLLLNPYFKKYTVDSDSLKQSYDISTQPSQLKCFSERTKDSVFIVVENPRKLSFTYNIYRKNTEIKRGFTDNLSITKKAANKQNYIVSIMYLWGGKVKEENYTIPLNDKTLNLTVIQPRLVYPGQKSKIEILVTDNAGNPVRGVDLTAYSLTKKFYYTAPELPYLGKDRKNKAIINYFSFTDFKEGDNQGPKLDYKEWRRKAGLDSIEYYKFIYPGNKLYRFEFIPKDSLTQFSPFVISDGAIKPVHVIYVDNKPVYFSWSTNIQPFSFKIDPGIHQIKLRTGTNVITVDSIFFKPGKKLIFSLNDNLVQKNIRIEKTVPSISVSERLSLYRYIFPYRNTFGERYAYIENGNSLQFLKPSPNAYFSENFAGPVAGNIVFNLLDGSSTNFSHEPFFEYDFTPGLLKMRTIDERTRYPKFFSDYNVSQSFSDLLLTKENIKKQWIEYTDEKRYLTARYIYPSLTSPGAGKLLIMRQDSVQDKIAKDIPLNLLVFRYDNPLFIRVYPGNTTLIHQLDKGLHKLIFFYSGARYVVADSLYVQPNGLNYYQIHEPLSFRKDTFSLYVSHLIEETIFNTDPRQSTEEKELKQIYNMYQQSFRYNGEGTFIDGYVYENGTEEPIPGVNVIAKGTSYGAITDLKGHYSLKIPSECNVLVFSSIGFVNQEISIANRDYIDVRLMPAIMSLQEVVVTGYGSQKKSNLTASVATIATNSFGSILGVSSNFTQSLQGRISGVQIISDSIAPGSVSLRIRGVNTTNFEKKPLYIINGAVYMGDIGDLDPELIENIVVIKDARATSLYGASGANGVLLINTKGGEFKPAGKKNAKGAEYDNTFLEAASKENSIRDNFSDYAFWKPRLQSDNQGKASFDATFPDDVTSWNTFYLAMNDHRQSGQTESTIKSYKPLMAQLTVPRFLIQSDTTYAIGKIVNYTPDSIKVRSNFEINNKNEFSKDQVCSNSVIDTLKIVAKDDSINIKYYLKKADGYIDGELKKVPVFPRGLEETKGNFYVLQKDTTLDMSFDPDYGKVSLYAWDGFIDVINNEIAHLMKYKYFCNEQIASKLKALLASKIIDKYKNVKFKDDHEIEKLIRLLLKNQESNSLWGWWKNSEQNYWISLHVVEALMQAKKMGYTVNLNEARLKEDLLWAVESRKDFSSNIRILRLLKLLNVPASYNSYIKNLEKEKKQSLNSRLQLMELSQLCNLPNSTDSIQKYKQKTLFGSVYFSDHSSNYDLLDNDIHNTILAYRILKNDTTTKTILLEKIRNYFFEVRGSGFWKNTYESSLIIETILPDLIANKTQLRKTTLNITGDATKTITSFPFEYETDSIEKIKISKTGDFPLFFTSYQRFWNPKHEVKSNDLIITTDFDNIKSGQLKAGMVTKLIARLEVKKDADYVMINIPVPGGCSYAEKGNNYKYEVHREYFKNETTIFCEKLRAGKYTFEIDLIPRYSGSYTLNPAKVELMYFPTFNANNELKKVYIK